MQFMLNLAFTDAMVGTVNIIIILILLFSIYDGYKSGFLVETVEFVGTVIAFVLAYLFKNPLSVFLYKHLPFFKIGGIFKGVSVINILIYELIGFLVLFIILMVIIKIILNITGIINKIISLIAIIGLPNKILGAVLCLLKTFIILFFLSCTFRVTMSFKGIEVNPTLADDIIEIPILKNTFGSSFASLDEIGSIAKNYESVNDKEEYNFESLKILLKYNVITYKNAEYLIDNGKIKIPSQYNTSDLLKNEKGD